MLIMALLPACALGLMIGMRVPLALGWSTVLILHMLACALLVGALIVAAEAGSAAARYLGLIAVLAGSAALSGTFAAVRRLSNRAMPRP